MDDSRFEQKMKKLVTVLEIQSIEHEADASGLYYSQMMENAGKGLAEIVSRRFSSGDLHVGRLSAGGLVGSGNNGGDTLVALSHLAQLGWSVSACLVRARKTDDPLLNRFLQSGGELILLDDLVRWIQSFANDTVLLDGVMGTGTRLPLKPDLAFVLDQARTALLCMPSKPHIVAVDCPSGIDCDTGDAAPEAIPANLTVVMGAVKQGLLSFPAYNLVGELEVISIGPIHQLNAWKEIFREVIDCERIRSILPPRPLDAHKGTFGTVMVVAGSVPYTGAALLAGKAAYLSGAGWVTMAVPEPIFIALAGHLPEAPWLLLPHESGYIAEGAAEVIRDNLGKSSAILLGPGFGLESTTKMFLSEFLSPALPPMVLDADGLKLTSKLPGWASRLPRNCILTPHPGEMAILTGLPLEEIQRDRIHTAEHFSKKWDHVVVLKGAFTVIASPDSRTAVIPIATPALARAGTGDVLAGLISGFRAQGMDAFDAAITGAWIHGQAGLASAEKLGASACVLAGDVLDAVVSVMRRLDFKKENG